MEDPALHHKTLVDALMEQLERMAPHTHRSASFIQKGWHLWDDEKKRHYLRMMIQTLRECRTEASQYERRSAAAMLALGPEGIEAIYDLEPEQAVAQARETLEEMTQAKASLELLRAMNLMAGVAQVSQVATQAGAERTEEGVEAFKKGHEVLIDNLETAMAAGSTILLACISRAGGATLNDQERDVMRAQWGAAVNGATSA